MSADVDAAREALLADLDKAFTEPVIAPVTWRLALRPATVTRLDAFETAIRAEGLDVEAMLPWLSGNLSEEDYWTVRNALEAYARLAKEAER